MSDLHVIIAWFLVVLFWLRVVCKPGKRCSIEEQRAALRNQRELMLDLYISRGYTKRAAHQAVNARLAESISLIRNI